METERLRVIAIRHEGDQRLVAEIVEGDAKDYTAVQLLRMIKRRLRDDAGLVFELVVERLTPEGFGYRVLEEARRPYRRRPFSNRPASRSRTM